MTSPAARRSRPPVPLDPGLYALVKSLANRKFLAPTSAYKSAWIVAEYKKRGGRYSGNAREAGGLSRWFREKWVDLRRPKFDNKGRIVNYAPCGRSSSSSTDEGYPLCRPLSQALRLRPGSVKGLLAAKQRVQHSGRIRFV